MASPLARRFCARMLSERQFDYLPWWKYCVDFVFHSNGQTRVFYSVYFVFMFLSCTLLVLFWFMGRSNTPHHTASPLARRFCVRMLSERQFEYLPWWKYCVDFVFIWMVRHASSILCISFSCFYRAHCWCCFDSWVAVLPHPSPHINNPSRDVFMRGFRPLDNSNILSRILCCFRFLSNTWDMRPRWFVWISSSWISQSHDCVDKIYGCCWVICPLQI